MNKAPASVIKHDDVKVGGKVRLDSGVSRVTESSVAGAAGRAANMASTVSARIVRTAPDHVMIEVICACGTKTMLRCDY
jgi:hypothetical protein